MRANPLQDSDVSKTINFCFTTYRSCLETLNYAQEEGTRFYQADLFHLLQLCADTCDLTARSLISGADFGTQSCELCFEVCLRTAEECDRFSDDHILAKCGEVCRRCAQFCRGMSGMTVRVTPTQAQAVASSSARL